MKINLPRILGTVLTIIFLSGLAQTAQPAPETGTVALKELTPVNHVYLLNGDRISGTVLSLNKDVLFLDCLLSKRLRIDMRTVMAIDFQPKMQKSFQPRKEEMDKIDFINGDKITGDVLSLSEKTITIKGENGKLVLKKEGLSQIVFGLREKVDLGFPREEATWRRNEGLVAYYPFHGNAHDESTHGNHGKVIGATLTEDRFGNPNGAYSFSGKDNYVNCGNSHSLEITEDMTIEAWIYPAGLNYDAGHGIIVKKGDCTHTSRDAYYLELTGVSLPANINFSLSDGSSGSYYTAQGVIPSLNNWYHVAATYDRAEGKVRLYVNGILHKTADRNAQTNPAASHNVFIGREVNQNYSERRFIGKIDEVRLYNRALSETEIRDYYLIESRTGGAKISGYGKWNKYFVTGSPPDEYAGPEKWKGFPLQGKVADTYRLVGPYGPTGYLGLGTFLYAPENSDYEVQGEADDYGTVYIDGVFNHQFSIPSGEGERHTIHLTQGWHRIEITTANTASPGLAMYWGTTDGNKITSISGVNIDSGLYDAWVADNW